jgi:predicted small lipoprotein YifL
MSRIHVVLGVLALAALALGLAAVAGCGDEPPSPAPPSEEVVPDLPDLKKKREEVAKADTARRAELDQHARALLASFDSRVYRPTRDGGIERAAGRIDVKSGGKEASYGFSYDAANPADAPVKFETLSEPAGWDPAIATDVRRWGVFACVGAFEVVAYFRPPIQMWVWPSGGKEYVVVAPQYLTPLNVSYSLNADQVITARGEWTDEAHKFVTNYEWEQKQTRWFLRGAKIWKGASSRFEYDHRGELVLLRTIHVDDGARTVDAQITFDKTERRAK